MDILKQWKQILDTLQDGILVLDTQGNIQIRKYGIRISEDI